MLGADVSLVCLGYLEPLAIAHALPTDLCPSRRRQDCTGSKGTVARDGRRRSVPLCWSHPGRDREADRGRTRR